ncbi:hypothetical protein [Desulfatibacillum aliphaticivorans]|uniref:hypothetical protein n=1 Tax=Desulfatibacillum aliphaticivorans TaxID=218208 RepID=UPI0003FF2FD7|nr:hypothetical protein [Desulfatibacillum aliphaticivorans]
MAQVIGYPTRQSIKKDLSGLLIMLGMAVLTAALMFDPGANLKSEVFSSLAVGAGIALVLVFVYSRINPMGFQRIVSPKTFERNLFQDQAAADALNGLDDDAYVFHGFILELFRVEHLVISGQGIFVISKVRKNGEIAEKNGVLYCGEDTLETLTGNTWRICHLISIVLKKYFRLELMPRPVILVPEGSGGSIKESGGIAILTNGELGEFIQDKPDCLDQETAASFAAFVRKRYAAHK